MTKSANNRDSVLAHFDANCTYHYSDERRFRKRLRASQVILCPVCLKRCPRCNKEMPAEAPELVAQDREMVKACPSCALILFLWVDWDGSTAWWGRVRDVRIAPAGDWAAFRDWCLDRLGSMPCVVVQGRKGGHVAVFCANRSDAKRVKRDILDPAYAPYGMSAVGLSDQGCLSLSFEFGSASARPVKFLTSTLEWGPMRILLPL